MSSQPGNALVLYRPAATPPAPLYQRTAGDVAERVYGRLSMAFRVDTKRRQEQGNRSAHRLSMSGIGRCQKWAAYTLAGTPVSEEPFEEEGREAAIGTWIHLCLLPLMRELTPGSLIELPVILKAAGLEIKGTLDWLWVAEDGFAEVGDLKTVREWKLNRIDRNGVFEDHEYQVWAYALAAAQLGYKVRWVWWLYLDRSTGQVRVKVEEFTNERAFAVLQRVTLIKHRAETDPDAAKREGRGPGLDPMCDGCPWLRRCWGPTAKRGVKGAQSHLSLSIEGIVEALGLLHRSNGIKSQAEKDAEFARLVLAEVAAGPYRQYVLKLRPMGKALDQRRSRAKLEALGQTVPMIDRGTAISVSTSDPRV